ncbi:hypothetical protein ABBQ32_004321 [Trebouxia sp. C0010 RCD-2024]
MIVDGMSKWKTMVPHFAREHKSFDSQGHKLQYPLTASKIHGLCNVADWQYGGQFQGSGSGCNFSCSILLANLQLVEELRGRIPRHLKLQMDNCAKDNKNCTVLGFCALLVELGVVETVKNAFTPLEMNALFALAGKAASRPQERGSRAGVGIDHGFLPTDKEESRHWNVFAE